MGSSFMQKHHVIDNILDIDRVDVDQTVIEEISDSMQSDSSKHLYST